MGRRLNKKLFGARDLIIVEKHNLGWSKVAIANWIGVPGATIQGRISALRKAGRITITPREIGKLKRSLPGNNLCHRGYIPEQSG